jgi:hypothetical protein
MRRWWVAAVLAFACSNKASEGVPPMEDESKYRREAEASLEAFRVLVADFHADFVAGRFEAAYDRLAPMYRASMPLEMFVAGATHPFFRDGMKFTVRRSSTTAGTAKVSLLMTGPLGTSQLELRSSQIDGVWKIAGISVDGAPVLPAP